MGLGFGLGFIIWGLRLALKVDFGFQCFVFQFSCLYFVFVFRVSYFVFGGSGWGVERTVGGPPSVDTMTLLNRTPSGVCGWVRGLPGNSVSSLYRGITRN